MKPSISSMVGGNPIKSRLTRRISCSLEVRGASCRSFFCSSNRMNRSIEFWKSGLDLTWGGWICFSGWKAQCCRSASVIDLPKRLGKNNTAGRTNQADDAQRDRLLLDFFTIINEADQWFAMQVA